MKGIVYAVPLALLLWALVGLVGYGAWRLVQWLM
jgi:hypothetical protein